MIEFPKYGKHMWGVGLAASNAPVPTAALGAHECKSIVRAVGDRFSWDDWHRIYKPGRDLLHPPSSSPFCLLPTPTPVSEIGNWDHIKP